MICPYCSTAVKYDFSSTGIFFKDGNENDALRLNYALCPNCHELIIYLQNGRAARDYPYDDHLVISSEKMIYPQKSSFSNSQGIPLKYIEDYEEAILVLSASPKASAALTRRLLQSILHDEYKVKEKTLFQEIEKFITIPGIPSHLTDAVDAIRHIGNLAAHPTKNQNTGEIVPVENGEAEWLIEVIEALFDFTFIQPTKLEKRKKELNEKLENAGKAKMK